MSADRIRVTVGGEPVTREVSWDDVRAYLRANGWTVVNEGGFPEYWRVIREAEYLRRCEDK